MISIRKFLTLIFTLQISATSRRFVKNHERDGKCKVQVLQYMKNRANAIASKFNKSDSLTSTQETYANIAKKGIGEDRLTKELRKICQLNKNCIRNINMKKLEKIVNDIAFSYEKIKQNLKYNEPLNSWNFINCVIRYRDYFYDAFEDKEYVSNMFSLITEIIDIYSNEEDTKLRDSYRITFLYVIRIVNCKLMDSINRYIQVYKLAYEIISGVNTRTTPNYIPSSTIFFDLLEINKQDIASSESLPCTTAERIILSDISQNKENTDKLETVCSSQGEVLKERDSEIPGNDISAESELIEIDEETIKHLLSTDLLRELSVNSQDSIEENKNEEKERLFILSNIYIFIIKTYTAHKNNVLSKSIDNQKIIQDVLNYLDNKFNKDTFDNRPNETQLIINEDDTTMKCNKQKLTTETGLRSQYDNNRYTEEEKLENIKNILKSYFTNLHRKNTSKNTSEYDDTQFVQLIQDNVNNFLYSKEFGLYLKKYLIWVLDCITKAIADIDKASEMISKFESLTTGFITFSSIVSNDEDAVKEYLQKIYDHIALQGLTCGEVYMEYS